jgi:ABC-type antimicrobial peptide transport system permease subunit
VRRLEVHVSGDIFKAFGTEVVTGRELQSLDYETGRVMLLSAMGIHALMSFTVSRRTREIGIRVALGAGARGIVTSIFRRAFLQLAAGLVIGSGIGVVMGMQSALQVKLLIGANAMMLAVGMMACALPVRRALRIDPAEALRAEG